MRAAGDPGTLAGVLLLASTRRAYATETELDPRFGTSVLGFAPDGVVAVGRDYWVAEPGRHRAFAGWGR